MNKEITNKIQKLLKLTKNTNENEAKAAMLRVQELLAKYKLSMSDIEEEEKANSPVQTTSSDVVYACSVWKGFLANTMADNFSCCTFSRRISTKKKKIFFIGKEDDVNICIATFKYAIEYADAEIKKLKALRKKQGGSTRNVDNAYGLGFQKGLKEAFENQKEQNKEKWGLILVTPEDVQNVYDSMNIKTKSIRSTVYSNNSSVFDKGVEDGQKFNMKNSIGTSSESKKVLA